MMHPRPATASPVDGRRCVLPSSRVTLRPLAIHGEDGEFIVGRVDAGSFAAMPEIAVRIIQLLQRGCRLQDVQAQLAAEHGADVDLEAFVEDLLQLEFIASIDGQPLPAQPIARSHLPWIEARHVGWIFRWPGALAYAALLAGGALALAQHPDLLPSYRDFFWTASSSLVLAGNALWLAVNQLLHELAHLIAARSLDLPGRIGLSTRLHFLVAQTELSSLWSVPRRRRFRVYLAGIAWDLVPIAVGLILSACLPVQPQFRRILAAVMLINWLGIVWQFNVYLRTDMYYVILELARGRNLYQDSLAYLASWGRRLLRRLQWAVSARRRPLPAGDPVPRQVRLYASLILVGSGLSLAVFLAYSLPLLLSMLTQAIGSMLLGARAHAPLAMLDGAVSAVVLLAGQVLFLITFVRRRTAVRPPADSDSVA